MKIRKRATNILNKCGEWLMDIMLFALFVFGKIAEPLQHASFAQECVQATVLSILGVLLALAVSGKL